MIIKNSTMKMALEHQVVGPDSSNAPDHMQSYQQHGVLLDD